MKASTLRDVLVVAGIAGIGASVWLKDQQLVPGIIGAVLLIAALASFLVGKR